MSFTYFITVTYFYGLDFVKHYQRILNLHSQKEFMKTEMLIRNYMFKAK